MMLQSSNSLDSGSGGKLFTAKETEVFIRLVKWAMQALDVYTLSVTPVGGMIQPPGQQRIPPQQTVRTKEEKEVLEHFSGVVSEVYVVCVCVCDQNIHFYNADLYFI